MKAFCKWLFIIGLLLSGAANAESEITIYGADNKPPKIYLDGSTPKGFLIDILHYIDKQLADYTFNIQLYPFPRAYRYALYGKGAIVGLSKNLEREKLFDYSDTVYLDEVIVVVRHGEEFPFSKLADLNGKDVSTGLGGSYGQEFEDAKKAGLINFVEDNQPQFSLHKLLAGRVDCALINPGREGLEYLIANDKRLAERRDEFSALPIPFQVDPNFLGVSKGAQMKPFVEQFNQALQMGITSGDIPEIISSYSLNIRDTSR